MVVSKAESAMLLLLAHAVVVLSFLADAVVALMAESVISLFLAHAVVVPMADSAMSS